MIQTATYPSEYAGHMIHWYDNRYIMLVNSQVMWFTSMTIAIYFLVNMQVTWFTGMTIATYFSEFPSHVIYLNEIATYFSESAGNVTH